MVGYILGYLHNFVMTGVLKHLIKRSRVGVYINKGKHSGHSKITPCQINYIILIFYTVIIRAAMIH